MDNETLQLFVVGINYKTSTISEREIFQINRKEISHSLNYFNSREEVEGVVIVSTCNRLEFYLVLKQDALPFDIVTILLLISTLKRKKFLLTKNKIYFTFFLVLM